jgi:hypothetical protein
MKLDSSGEPFGTDPLGSCDRNAGRLEWTVSPLRVPGHALEISFLHWLGLIEHRGSAMPKNANNLPLLMNWRNAHGQEK